MAPGFPSPRHREPHRPSRRARQRTSHPVHITSHHVAIALLELGLGLLGIGALVWAFFGALLPRLNLPDVLPDIEISLPGFVKTILSIPDRIIAIPIRWIRTGYDRLSGNIDLSDWSALTSPLLSWFQGSSGAVRIFIPVAIEEVQRRKGRNAPAEPPSSARDEASDAESAAPKTAEASANNDAHNKAAAGRPALAGPKRQGAQVDESDPD